MQGKNSDIFLFQFYSLNPQVHMLGALNVIFIGKWIYAQLTCIFAKK